MEQYIDKDAVIAELERLYNLEYANTSDLSCGKKIMLRHILLFLNNLEVKEVDLDFQRFAKEMEIVFALPSSKTKNTEEEPLNWEYAIAKHFYKLGLKSKSSHVGIPNIDDTLKEMGVDPDSKLAKSFKESYFRVLDELQTKQLQK